MSAIVPVLRALVRDELAATSAVELGTVTDVATNEGGRGERNGEVNVRLRGSGLELQRVPVATARTGVSAVPRKGDLVVVAFVGGDLNGAVALGVLHTDTVHPPDAKPEEVVYEVSDPAAGGVRRAQLRLPGGNTLTVEDSKVVIDLGGSKVTVEDGSVTVTSGDITMEASGDLTLKADGDIAIEASGSATLKAAAKLQLEASGVAQLKGATTTIAGTTSFSAG